MCPCGGAHSVDRMCEDCRSKRLTGIQTKLGINQPGDQYEQEADRIADQVMRMPAPAKSADAPAQTVTSPFETAVPSIRQNRGQPLDTPTEALRQTAYSHARAGRGGDLQAARGSAELARARRAQSQSRSKEVLVNAHAEGGPRRVRELLDRTSPDPRVRAGALLGVDLSFVRMNEDAATGKLLDELAADGAVAGPEVYIRPGLGQEERWVVEAHELAHAVQTRGQGPGLDGAGYAAAPDSAIERDAERAGQEVASFMPTSLLPQSADGAVLRGKGKVVAWIVKVGERKLVQRTAIYTEREVANRLAKGYNVLVKDGRQVAKRIAKRVWGDNVLHHTGHMIKKIGKLGRPHYQPLKHGAAKAGEKGWHIFYSAVPVLFFADDVQAMAIYEDKYPGKSIANYLTVTKYVGESSWLRHLDWINPLELIAIGGDIGRDWDRERTKELKALVFSHEAADGSVVTYELDTDFELVRVFVNGSKGEYKELTAQQYYVLLESAEAKAARTKPKDFDATTHRNYAGALDEEYRIYFSKQGWQYDGTNLAFFLPEADAKKLERVGPYYVGRADRVDHFYVYVHPMFRPVLRQPGFSVSKEARKEYDKASNKVDFLTQVLGGEFGRRVMKQTSFLK
jgi:hypothetical protein